MNSFDISLPKDLIYGNGSLSRIGEIASRLGSNGYVLLFDAPGAADVEKQIADAFSSAGIKFKTDQSIKGEPSVEDADAATERCRESGCDLVVSIGGGSVIDTGKIVSFLAKNPGSSREYQMGERRITESVIPHIAVPTTSGTGAEGTKVAVLSNKQAGVKKSMAHPAIVPTVALLDPALTISLPPALTALTGLDALSHAVESYVSLNANAFTETCGIKAIELIGKSLHRAVKDGSDVEARGDMAMASYLAGISLNAGVGAAHILAQPLGAAVGVSHSGAIASVLPTVIELNCLYSREKYARIAQALGEDIHGLSPDQAASTCSSALTKLYTQIGVSERLSRYGLSRSGFDQVLDIVSRSTAHIKCNPRPVDNNLLIRILDRSL